MNLKSLTFFSCILNVLAANAGTMGEVPPEGTRVLTLSAGPAWSNTGESQTFFLQPGVQKTYSAHNNTSTLAEVELFYGRQGQLSPILWGQLGLAVAAASNASLTGDIWEDADPAFNNFTYRYRVNHYEFAIKGNLLFDIGHPILPYLSGKLGIGFNQAHEFIIKPKIFEEIPAPNFGANTQTAFSYAVGVGIQKVVTDFIRVNLGYEFADWGRSRLARAPGQTLNQGLTLNHLYTNCLQFGISYVS